MYKFLLYLTHVFVGIFIVNTIQSQFLFTNIDSLQVALSNSKTDTAKLATTARIGFYYWNRDPDKSNKYLKLAYAMQVNDQAFATNYKLMASTILARTYAALNDTKQEEVWTNESRKHLFSATNADALDYGYEQLALININSGKFDSGIFYANKAISMWDSLNMPKKSLRAYFTIANTYFMMRFHNKAVESLNKLIKLSGLNLNDKSPILLNVFRLFADVYANKNQHDSVLYFCNKGLAIAKKLNNVEVEIDFYTIQSAALEATGKYNEAISTATKGYNLAKENGYEAVYANLFQVLALSYAALNNKSEALQFVSKSTSYRIANLQSSLEYNSIYELWATVHERLGNFKQAYAYKDSQYTAYKSYKDSSMEAEAIENDIKFQTAKKEITITTLETKNKQQQTIQWLIAGGLLLSLIAAAFAYRSYRNKKKTAEVLEQSNKEKEVFLKEIHHRVKNNLQIISSLLYMQFKDSKDEGMMAQLKQAQERIKSMALVHNKLYETQDVVHVYLKEYMQDLATGILSSNTPSGKSIELQIEANESINLSLDTSISLGLMLNELITNSCKYAFANKEKGNIKITLQQTSNNYILTVTDDGSGLPEGFEQKNSLGVRLVKNLARQLQGKVSFQNNNGTIVQIQFTNSIAA